MKRVCLLVGAGVAFVGPSTAFVHVQPHTCMQAEGRSLRSSGGSSSSSSTAIPLPRRRCDLSMSLEQNGVSRRELLDRLAQGSSAAVAVAVAATAMGSPQQAWAAKGEEVEVVWDDEFKAVKADFDSWYGDLEAAVKAEDWDKTKSLTQTLDQSFRKRVMGGTRRKFPSSAKALKEEGLSLCNAVTFDLIATSKAARAKDGAGALKVLQLLTDDVNSFLKLQSQLPATSMATIKTK